MKIKDFRDGRHCVGAAAIFVFAAMAQAAPPQAAGPQAKNPAVTLEAIPGTNVRRVILAPKAAERLGIATAPVSEQPIARRQMVGGLIIAAVGASPPDAKPTGGFGGFAQTGAASPPVAQRASAAATGAAGGAHVAPAVSSAGFASSGGAVQVAAAPGEAPSSALSRPVGLNSAWVAVSLTPGEWERLAKDKPVRLLPLATRESLKRELIAQPSGLTPREDTKRSMLTVYYALPGSDHGLTLNQRMRVELQLAGTEQAQKVVPYSAVYYDAKGNAWVYVNTKPYVFERQLVSVERVAGDVAALSEGPPVGTQVVATGAALLYGAEIFGK